MKRPAWPYQAILERFARPYSSASSPAPDVSQPWPQLRRRARPSSTSPITEDSRDATGGLPGANQWLGELGRSSANRTPRGGVDDAVRADSNRHIHRNQTIGDGHAYDSIENRGPDLEDSSSQDQAPPPGMDYDGDIELRYFTPGKSPLIEVGGGKANLSNPRQRRQPRQSQSGGGGNNANRGPELWFRRRSLPDQRWQRVNGNWTLRQTPRGPELMRIGAPTLVGDMGVSVLAKELAMAESPFLKLGAEKRMVTIGGLSKNLTDRDFHRISSQSLTGWDDTITKVQQERDPLTFEPLGVYKLSFTTGLAATSYLHDLSCRHRVAKARAGSQFGLWENTMSRYLRKRHELEEEGARAGVGEGDGTVGPDAFTLAPPTAKSLHTKRSRISVKGWQKALGTIVEGLGYKPGAPVVLVDMYPPEVTPRTLDESISRDEQARGVSWHASKAASLQSVDARNKALGRDQERDTMSMTETPGGGDWLEAEGSLWTSQRDEVRNGRFVMAFPSDTHAARFQRSWHRRTLTAPAPNGEESSYTVSVQVVQW